MFNLDEATALHDTCTRELEAVRKELVRAEGNLEAMERAHAEAAIADVKRIAEQHNISLVMLLAALNKETKPTA